MTLAPILLFVYNRPLHVRRSIESLLAIELAKESELYIFSDAAKDEATQPNVNEVRQFIHSIKGFKEIHYVERTENWGLARNIIDGDTRLVNEYGRVIVLEDDLIVAPYFLQFMNDALETYKDEDNVCHIQACDFTKDPILPDTFLIKWTGSWGWATWKRAWKLFNPNGQELLDELIKRKLTYRFDFNGKYGYTRMLRNQIKGKNNSWAIRWNASLFLADKLSLNVGKSLIQNEGFDGSGTNCGSGNLYASDLWMKPLPVVKIQPIVENEEARQAFSNYYARTNSFFAKAIRRIKRTLKGDFGR
ncbi:MAG: glycosyltransferase [Prevotella sp.]|nr:glycosyltransferase [Prevotella sp.]